MEKSTAEIDDFDDEKYNLLKNELSGIMEAEINNLLIEFDQNDLFKISFEFDKKMVITFDRRQKKIISIVSSKRTEINIRRDLFADILAGYFQ